MGQSCSFKHICAPLGVVTRSLAAALPRAGRWLNRVKCIASARLTRGVHAGAGGVDVSSAPKKPDYATENWGLIEGGVE